tara:strand:- start:52 stop:954 length:903 start_codon:yes stop_codon:yes gene_type:complete
MAKQSNAGNSPTDAELNPNVDLTLDDAGVGNDSSDLFDDLDREVNGLILDDADNDGAEFTSEQETQDVPDPAPVDTSDHQHDYEKRYKDSSREARKLKDELDSLKQYTPIIERLKEDTGMVNVIKNYVENGEQPQNVKEALQLPEDFVFDLDEAMSNPGSLSGKALEHTISSVVDNRVNTQLAKEREIQSQETEKQQQAREADSFKKQYNISNDEYEDMMDWANSHKTSLEDIYYLKNRDSRDQKVARGVKEDVLKQMKSVRSIPSSVANKNTEKVETDPNDKLFDALANVDAGLEGLFK